MKKFTAKLFGGSGLFILLAILAVLVMGSTSEKPRQSDLDATAAKIISQSGNAVQNANDVSARAILRANIIGK